MAFIHAVLAITVAANQVATGLALSIFGSGLSAFLGAGYVGKTITGLRSPLLFSLLGNQKDFSGVLIYSVESVPYS